MKFLITVTPREIAYECIEFDRVDTVPQYVRQIVMRKQPKCGIFDNDTDTLYLFDGHKWEVIDVTEEAVKELTQFD